MLLIFTFLLFLAIATAISVFGYVRFAKPANMLDRLATSTSTQVVTVDPAALEGKSAAGFAKLLESFGRLLPYSSRDVDVMKRELVSAGFRSAYAGYVYLGIKLIACSSLLLLALLLRNSISDKPLNRLIIPIASAVGGFLAPGFVLARLTRARQEKIRLALPDVLRPAGDFH